MRPIFVLASQISTIRKNSDPIYFYVSGKWNSFSKMERSELHSILQLFRIHILYSDEEDKTDLPASSWMTKVDHDIWNIYELRDSLCIKHPIEVSFDQIRDSLNSIYEKV